MHLYIGSGLATVTSNVMFWGTRAALESIYMLHLTLATLGVCGLVVSCLFLPRPQFKQLLFMFPNILIFINCLWTLIWMVLELTAPVDFYRTFVEYWGNRFYAWGSHPFLPTLYWDRTAALLLSVAFLVGSGLAIIYYDTIKGKAALSIAAAYFGAAIMLSNLRFEYSYLVLSIILWAAAFTLNVPKLTNKKKLAVFLLCVAAISLVAFPAVSNAQIPCLATPDGQYFSVEYIPHRTVISVHAAFPSVTKMVRFYGFNGYYTVTSDLTSLGGMSGFISCTVPYILVIT